MSSMSGTLLEEIEARRSLPPPSLRRAIREAAHVSQRRLGRELNVANVTIGRWERGEIDPKGAQLLAYAQLLREMAVRP